MEGRLIAIVGPSGVGKDSVMEALAAAHPHLGLVKRVITRPEGLGCEDYEPVSNADFERRKKRGDFALDWPAHGLLYGIPKSVSDDLEQGQDLLVNLSRAILPAAQDAYPSLVIIRLTAKEATLRRRLNGRGRESVEDIERRLNRAESPMPAGITYTNIGNDGTLAETVSAALAILFPKDDLT